VLVEEFGAGFSPLYEALLDTLGIRWVAGFLLLSATFLAFALLLLSRPNLLALVDVDD